MLDAFLAFKPELMDYMQSVIPQWPREQHPNSLMDLIDYTTDKPDCWMGPLVLRAFVEVLHIDPSSEQARPACALGWMQEIQYASFVITQDMINNTALRDGKTAWHLKDKNGYSTVADAYFLENIVYELIDHYFKTSGQTTRRNLTRILRDTTLFTGFGQVMEMEDRTATIDEWKAITDAKLGRCAFWQCLALGLCGSERVPFELLNSGELKEMLTCAGELFQCRLDCRENRTSRSSWLFAKSFELGTEGQKAMLSQRPEEVYSQLQIDRECESYQKELYQKMETLIEKIDIRIPRSLLDFVLALSSGKPKQE